MPKWMRFITPKHVYLIMSSIHRLIEEIQHMSAQFDSLAAQVDASV